MEKNNIKTLQELVNASAEEYGDKIFVTEKAGKELVNKSFNQFRDDVKRLMAYVNTFRNGEPIHCAVSGASSYLWLVSYFGIVSGGNTGVPLDAQLGEDDTAELLNRSDSVIFFYDKRFANMIDGIKSKCPEVKAFVSIENDLPKILEKYQPEDFQPVEPSALATISYTSGTTGKSKGVMLLNSNLIDNAMCQD
nr:acyl--CoA ligase [Ruminococcus sp.]